MAGKSIPLMKYANVLHRLQENMELKKYIYLALMQGEMLRNNRIWIFASIKVKSAAILY